ncbi:DUF7144 family membrane protein [Actinomycetospora sp.]|jgi:hypothetical protein|uniref:DUF7144 family membrane protein n=1 Tax=Actinomycetospora sp. TaxID=1872135 RepID=UPI002F3FD4B5
MTEQQSPTAPRPRSPLPSPPADGVAPIYESPPAGAGWTRFAGVMMAVIGAFAAIEGLAALFAPTYFVSVNNTVLTIDLTGWGWLHLILGALVLVTGLSLLGSAPSWARWVGAGLVAINMLVQLAWLPAYPIWGIVAIALDVMILFALVATQGDRSDQYR